MSAEYLALLRGVNVGGKNKLPMRDLSEIVAALGCENVKTFIQSANVVFDRGSAEVADVGEAIGAGVQARFGFRPAVILRSRDELREVVARNPFLLAGQDAEIQHVVFLSQPLQPESVERLSHLSIAPDALAVLDKEIYLSLPNGVSGSQLTNANFYSKIGIHPARNWRTILKLAELMEV